MKYLLLSTFLLSSFFIYGQKRLLQTYDVNDIQSLYINSDEIFQIKITSTVTDQITIRTQIEGETFESSLLNSKIEDRTLHITTGYTPDFIPFNDKLSAHKILSIVLEITLPEYMNINVNSSLASIEGIGSYGNVSINLGRGTCRLFDFRFRESATIHTISGPIYIETENAEITAQSRNGNVVIPVGVTGIKALHLKSIHGDITVKNSL